MMWTTVPTYLITLIVFVILGLNIEVSAIDQTQEMLFQIKQTFDVTPWLFLVPLSVVLMIVKKTPPLIALLVGTLLGGVFALIFQPEVVMGITGAKEFNLAAAYKGIMDAITIQISIPSDHPILEDLFQSKGMYGMLGTIWLIVCAMVFGGIMDGIGALNRLSQALLSIAKTTFGLFASTVASCLALNLTASDQYISIVVPGKMFAKAYKDKGLAPENLSRTLEDSGTVTSVLVPWNTCGAYHSGVLGVPVASYFVYAIFNWLSPITTLIFAAFSIKIKQLRG